MTNYIKISTKLLGRHEGGGQYHENGLIKMTKEGINGGIQ